MSSEESQSASHGRHREEVLKGERFEFGENWSRLLPTMTEANFLHAEASLKEMLGVPTLSGKTFLDIGSGSGLFSLAARRLGAKVTSFDYDPSSVRCTQELRRRFLGDDPDWTVIEGSVLDREFLERLGRFDIVYSWGVLHHTGAMWEALQNVTGSVAPRGSLFIALYNDQGRASKIWYRVKRMYSVSPKVLRPVIAFLCLIWLWAPISILDLFSGRPFATWRAYKVNRGMAPYRDVVDWVGGYPFEVSTPEQIVDFYHGRGYQLRKLKTRGGGFGCNDFVFGRVD